MQNNKTVEKYIANHTNWEKELLVLRDMLLSTKLQETIKWGAPVYTQDNKNILAIGAFKPYVGLWFYQGALLKDKENKLINAQEGKTKSLRQWRFNSLAQIDQNKDLILNYIQEALSNHKQGKQIKPVLNKPVIIADELLLAFENDPQLKQKFETLSLSKRRDFADYISAAKRAATRAKRLDKITPMILRNEGLNDKYK
jgi:uncharacterized protein YdeI (YjbR/CyaY-like superfamily)